MKVNCNELGKKFFVLYTKSQAVHNVAVPTTCPAAGANENELKLLKFTLQIIIPELFAPVSV